MGYILPVDQHVVVGGLHGDDGMEGSEWSGDGWGVSALWRITQSVAGVSENREDGSNDAEQRMRASKGSNLKVFPLEGTKETVLICKGEGGAVG